jgi:hypothetical protein
MQVKTWLQRLTDESSLWFNAVKAEDDGDLISAVSYYLKDAQKSAQDKSIVREALSCSCAATCLAKRGNVSRARQLYLFAAKLYSSYAKLVISSSIRETSWLLREAHDNYVLAGDLDSATILRKEFLGLASRVNPFSDVNEVESTLDLVKKRAETLLTVAREDKLPSDIEELIGKLLENQPNFDEKNNVSASSRASVIKSLDLAGGSSIIEKSIVS